jgi:uncharacterized paraquat-inducible protein A
VQDPTHTDGAHWFCSAYCASEARWQRIADEIAQARDAREEPEQLVTCEVCLDLVPTLVGKGACARCFDDKYLA